MTLGRKIWRRICYRLNLRLWLWLWEKWCIEWYIFVSWCIERDILSEWYILVEWWIEWGIFIEWYIPVEWWIKWGIFIWHGEFLSGWNARKFVIDWDTAFIITWNFEESLDHCYKFVQCVVPIKANSKLVHWMTIILGLKDIINFRWKIQI